MSHAQQLTLPFACLDFPGRDTVAVWEIAAKLGKTVQHILDHIDEGNLVALDTKVTGSRRSLRIPVDEYRRWILSLLTSDARRTLVEEMPAAVLIELRAQIDATLRERGAA